MDINGTKESTLIYSKSCYIKPCNVTSWVLTFIHKPPTDFFNRRKKRRISKSVTNLLCGLIWFPFKCSTNSIISEVEPSEKMSSMSPKKVLCVQASVTFIYSFFFTVNLVRICHLKDKSETNKPKNNTISLLYILKHYTTLKTSTFTDHSNSSGEWT